MLSYKCWGMIVFIALGMVSAQSCVVINTSPSFPLGVYYKVYAQYRKGDLALVCPPKTSFFDESRKRRLIGYGLCPGGYGYLIKKIVAIGGDNIVIEDNGVFVNGQRLAHSQRQNVNFAYQTQRVAKLLTEQEVLLMSDQHSLSFDSRYFGPVSRTQIKARLHPLWLLDGEGES